MKTKKQNNAFRNESILCNKRTWKQTSTSLTNSSIKALLEYLEFLVFLARQYHESEFMGAAKKITHKSLIPPAGLQALQLLYLPPDVRLLLHLPLHVVHFPLQLGHLPVCHPGPGRVRRCHVRHVVVAA